MEYLSHNYDMMISTRNIFNKARPEWETAFLLFYEKLLQQLQSFLFYAKIKP